MLDEEHVSRNAWDALCLHEGCCVKDVLTSYSPRSGSNKLQQCNKEL